MEKKKKILAISTIILALLLIGSGGYIIYDKETHNEPKKTENIIKQSNDKEDNKEDNKDNNKDNNKEDNKDNNKDNNKEDNKDNNKDNNTDTNKDDQNKDKDVGNNDNKEEKKKTEPNPLPIIQSKNILTVVIPHHYITTKERLKFWDNVIKDAEINKDKIKKVIIIGPDHFGSIRDNVTYDNTDWSIKGKTYKSFFKRPDNFPQNYVLNTVLVRNDHSINLLIDETYNNFSNAEIATFIIGTIWDLKKLNPLISYINSTCNENCILVASVDFAHFVSADVANSQDERIIKSLQKKEISRDKFYVNGANEADSPESLYIMQEYAKKQNLNWKLYKQTNSTSFNPPATEFVSHVYGAYKE